MPPEIPKKKVVIATDGAFWDLGAGSRERILALVSFLARWTDLTVAVLSAGSERDLRRLQALPTPEFNVVFLATKRSAGKKKNQQAFEAFLSKHDCDVCIIEFIQLSYLVDVIPDRVRIMLDTHDIQSDKADSIRQQTNQEVVALTHDEEFGIFDKFDALIMIQQPDFQKISDLLGADKAVLAPHPSEAPQQQIRPSASRIGFIASEYGPNRDAISWFAHHVWPAIRRPGLTLNIYGRINRVAKFDDGGGILWRGFVPSLADIYGEVDVVINPVRMGAGLKIKNVEALGNGLPLVTTTHGSAGIEDGAGRAFLVADEPQAFQRHLSGLLDSFDRRKALGEAAFQYAQARFTAAACFGTLLEEINRD